jgi:hypothetical protein
VILLVLILPALLIYYAVVAVLTLIDHITNKEK